MKIVITTIVSALLLLAASAQAQVQLQNFSSVYPSASTVFYGTWAANGDTINGDTTAATGLNQGSGVFNVTGSGVTNAASSKLEIFNAAPVSIVGSSSLLGLTAQVLAGNSAGGVTVTLVDTSSRIVSASFDTSLFPNGSYTTVYASLSGNPLFNYGSVDSLQISGGAQTGIVTFAMSFDNIAASAIPEPSTYAAIFGLSCLGLAIARKYKRREVAAV